MKNHQLKRFIPRNLETDPVINHIVHFDLPVLLKRRREEKEKIQRVKEEAKKIRNEREGKQQQKKENGEKMRNE